jgi:hypothetical protein
MAREEKEMTKDEIKKVIRSIDDTIVVDDMAIRVCQYVVAAARKEYEAEIAALQLRLSNAISQVSMLQTDLGALDQEIRDERKLRSGK